MAWCSSIVGTPCFPVVLILIMESCSKIGLVKAMGILFGHLSRSIQMSSTDLGIALGLFYTVGLLSTPFVASVITRTSHPRLLLICGATMGSTPIIVASMATCNLHLFIALAVSGAGYCALRMTCITALHRLAGENFNLLFSLSTCGYAAGMVLFPFLADELLTAYDWRGVLLILGGVMLNIIPCALAIRITPEDFTPRDDEGLQRRLEQVESDTISIAGSVRSCSDAERDNDRDDAVKDTDRDDAVKDTDRDDAVKDTDMTPLLTSSARHDRYVRIDADHPSPDNEIPHKNRLAYINGAGYCALRMTCITALHRLAGENFNLLFSLSTCGYAAGMVLFPFLADELLTAYDWRGVLLILGGVMLNIIPCALAIRITPEDFTPRDYEGLQRRLEQVESDTISIAGSVRSCSDAERDNDRDDAVKDTDRDDAVKDTDMTPLLTSSARHDRQ
eukprot:XP_011674678.1 PREDICTED: monocarboxylate transporter 5-like [Strongylocentrotus purpuratus]